MKTFCILLATFGYSLALNLFNVKPPIATPAVASSLPPSSGIIPYIGNTVPSEGPRWKTDELYYKKPSSKEEFWTKWNLWRQYPWKKIGPKRIVLKAKIGGSLPLESTPPSFSFGSRPDFEPIESLTELQTMFTYASHDPRIEAVLLDIGGLQCGYAKLQEVRRIMSYFRQSGKRIVGYCDGGAEKELYLALGCDEFYIPPDGGLDLRGFSAAATFVRGIFDKIGIEPQVQRIGKYKSFGDTFNRTSISEAQREVISSLLMEASDFWADSVAASLNKTTKEVMQLWSDTGIKTPYSYKELGYVTGIKYLDQVEDIVIAAHTQKPDDSTRTIIDNFKETLGIPRKNSSDMLQTLEKEFLEETADFSLINEFANHPRRQLTDFNASDLDEITRSSRANTEELVKQAAEQSTSSRQEDLTNFENALKNKQLKGLKNSTDIIQAFTFFTKMSILYEKNVITLPEKKVSDAGAESGAEGSGKKSMSTSEEIASMDTLLRSAYVTALKRENNDRLQAKKFAMRRLSQPGPRLFPAGLYLRKMRKGARVITSLPIQEVRGGPRIVVINAVGGIGTGKSGNGAQGKTLGSDTLIGMVRQARSDPSVVGVVLRVDSPGGSALASDLMWREIRGLSREKPVVASMVDVAASGGYYIAMACDSIVAEELTVTGSIGVVTSKFNLKELNEKIGYNTETLSRGRYAEVLSSSRGFTTEESTYFEDNAMRAYKSFITKAAASRSMDVDAMHEVAQGRVWTGRQALQRGLVDKIGGLHLALLLCANLAERSVNPKIMQKALSDKMRIQTYVAPRSGFPLPGVGSNTRASGFNFGSMSNGVRDGSKGFEDKAGVMAICDEALASTGLVSTDLLGIGPATASLGLSPALAYSLSHSAIGDVVEKTVSLMSVATSSISSNDASSPFKQILNSFVAEIADELL